MNKQKIYRVESSRIQYPTDWLGIPVHIGMGPYAYIKTTTVDITRLQALLVRNEPASENPKKERLARIGLFATFKDRRPGPAEDPYLRSQLKKRHHMLFDNVHLYGFDSIEQLDHWFSDSEEREELKQHGFGIVCYYAKNVLLGLRQIAVCKTDILIRKESISL